MSGDGAARGSSFGVAFRLLPPAQRGALGALYGFCRAVDDAVDETPSAAEARRQLDAWRRALAAIYDGAAPAGDLPADGALIASLADAVARFPIHRADLEAVIEGCEWDLEGRRYEDFTALRAYCLRVASAVGLAAIEIFGYRDPRARDYAIDLGIALQLTNILRDVDEDAARGRIYLPAADLSAFGVDAADLTRNERGGRPPAVVNLLRFEAERARLHYQRACAALPAADRARLVAAEVMRDVYFALLEQIERDRFPHARASLPRTTKLRLVARRVVIARGVRLGARAASLGQRMSRMA